MKLLFGLMLTFVVSGAFADDGVAVVERVTCADMSANISELAAIEAPTEDEQAELADLKAEYRRKCVQSARGRRVSSGQSVTPADQAVTTEEVTEMESVAIDDEADVVAEPDSGADVVTITYEQELANLDAGLCADGSAPNRFGCCGDEVFKDLGDTVFACCPKDGNGDCFPPLK